MFNCVTNSIIKGPLNRLFKKKFAEKGKTVKRGMRTENGEIKKREKEEVWEGVGRKGVEGVDGVILGSGRSGLG